MTAGRAADPAVAAVEQQYDADGLLGHVVRLNVAVDRVLADITGAHGISVADYLVLGVIRRSPQHRSAPTAICEVLAQELPLQVPLLLLTLNLSNPAANLLAQPMFLLP